MDSLWTMKAGEACEILDYDGVLAEPYKVRLMEFGFHPGGNGHLPTGAFIWGAQSLSGE